MNEKRRYRRLKGGVKVIYKVMGKKGEQEISSLDVGGGGVRVNLEERIEPGALLELNLCLTSEKETFFCLAKVAWQLTEPIKAKDGKDYYETGIEFLKLNLKDRLRIIHYIYTGGKGK